MRQITFYRQGRRDGGVRTGIEVDGEPVLEHFQPGPEPGDEDPVLTWFLVVDAKGPDLPADPEEARRWLRDRAGVPGELAKFANQLRSGIDVDSPPIRLPLDFAPEGTSIRVTGSAASRSEGQRFPKIVRDIARNWETYLLQLEPVEELHL